MNFIRAYYEKSRFDQDFTTSICMIPYLCSTLPNISQLSNGFYDFFLRWKVDQLLANFNYGMATAKGLKIQIAKWFKINDGEC